MDGQLTSYCGLYCRDCVPSNDALFSLMKRLEKMLEGLHLADYAAMKAVKSPVFRQYPAFVEVLLALLGLQCPGPCRAGGGKPECAIRDCAIQKGHEGCWQCTSRESCDRLSHLRSVHPNLDRHLDLIGRLGPDNWAEHRKAHYRWQSDLPKDEKPSSEFPEFMKNPPNAIAVQSRSPGVQGYVYDGADGHQMAFWECRTDGSSAEHVHDFDEYFVVLAGEYTVIVEGKETPVGPGQEMVIPKDVPHGGRFVAGTRTIHAFGGRRAERGTSIE